MEQKAASIKETIQYIKPHPIIPQLNLHPSLIINDLNVPKSRPIADNHIIFKEDNIEAGPLKTSQ